MLFPNHSLNCLFWFHLLWDETDNGYKNIATLSSDDTLNNHREFVSEKISFDYLVY